MSCNMTDSQKQAIAQKELGNEFYKKKDFSQAHKHYDSGIQLDPNNCSLYTNKAAAYYEEGKFAECIETCLKAVDIGRESRADYKIIAKAYLRAANACISLKNMKDALLYLDKSLSEHRDATVVKKRVEVEKEMKELERKAYINPDLSLEAKNLGNEKFKEGDFPSAMKHYTEAILRNPDDPKLYSNRAACYTKLMEFRLAVQDCDICIKLDPQFVKAYIRKGLALQALKETSKAAAAFEEALKVDPNSQEAIEGLSACMRSESHGSRDEEEVKRNVMKNPEVQSILTDPAMRMILEQMQSDPKAVQEHLSNPEIKTKLLKLMEAGVIQMR